MADDEVATRAPESDAAEDAKKIPPTAGSATDAAGDSTKQQTSNTTESPIPGDTIAQSGPSMGDHCVSDRPTPPGAPKPSGELTELAGVTSYISKPADYPHSPGKLLLLLTGGTGVHSNNNQLQADAYAARGFLVVMPDQFGGDPAPNTAHSNEPMSPGAEGSVIERVKEAMADAAKSFRIDMWLARHTPEKVLPILQKVVEAAREQFADAVANGGGIYGSGYCFGAKYILLLCGKHPDSVKWGARPAGNDPERGEAEKSPELKAGAIAHGTLITKEDVENVKSPISLVCIDNDNLFPDDVREQGRAALELNAVQHEIKIYEGAPHGFAVIGDYDDDGIRAKQKEAFEIMTNWLEKY